MVKANSLLHSVEPPAELGHCELGNIRIDFFSFFSSLSIDSYPTMERGIISFASSQFQVSVSNQTLSYLRQTSNENVHYKVPSCKYLELKHDKF